MKVVLNRVDGVHFVAQTESGHSISMDGSTTVGGEEKKGARPMEVLLVSLGGCSAVDVMSILKKSRQQVSNCEIQINAERVNAVPAVFDSIHIHYAVCGEQLNDKKVARAISLSMEKYCSVVKMLGNGVKISYGYEIKKDDNSVCKLSLIDQPHDT